MDHEYDAEFMARLAAWAQRHAEGTAHLGSIAATALGQLAAAAALVGVVLKTDPPAAVTLYGYDPPPILSALPSWIDGSAPPA